MLDLRLLEEKIEAALKRETAESIKEWLDRKRSEEFMALMEDRSFLFEKDEVVICDRRFEFGPSDITEPEPEDLPIAA